MLSQPLHRRTDWRGVVGIDEAGRGSWAGPVTAAAVLLKQPVAGLQDSKLLSKPARRQLFRAIQASGAVIGVGWSTASQVDRDGLTAAVAQAMTAALRVCSGYERVIIDGPYNFLTSEESVECLIDGDALHPSVSAASIVAKVLRDSYMSRLDNLLPDYGLAGHVGYGTAKHRQALLTLGPTKWHRLSYRPVKLAAETWNAAAS